MLEKTEITAVEMGGRAFHSGVGSELRAMDAGFEILSQTRAGINLSNLIKSKNIPWSEAELMWGRLSEIWAKGVPKGSTVPAFLNNPRVDAIYFTKELPILQANGVNIVTK